MTAYSCPSCGKPLPDVTPEDLAEALAEYGPEGLPECPRCTAVALLACGWDRSLFERFTPELLAEILQ